MLVLGSVRFEDKSVDATLLVLVASEISVDVFLIGDISASTAHASLLAGILKLF